MKTCRYSTNWMGPVSYSWTRENGEFWAAGRIDIRGNTESEYGAEISLPMMSTNDWNRLSHWLNSYKTVDPVTLDVLLEAYYNDGYAEIRWWKKK